MKHFENQDWLGQAAYFRGAKTALVDADRSASLTYAEAHQVANHYAQRLRSESIGARVALLAQDPLRTILLFFACQRLGLVLVPLNYRLSPVELNEIIADADPAALLFDVACESLMGSIRCAGPQIFLDEAWDPMQLVETPAETIVERTHEVCLMLYTSGTTGVPKGVLMTREMLFWNSMSTNLRLGLNEQDSTANFLPYFHTAAWNVLLLPLIHRYGTIILMARFDAQRVLEYSAQYSCTLLFGVPTTLRLMAEHPVFDRTDFGSLRFVITGGEAIAVDLIRSWQSRGVPVRQGYGLTEFGPNVFSLEADDTIRKIGSIGQPNPYCEAAIIDEAGQLIIGPAEGELVLKGSAVCAGYWRKPEMTRALFQDGWLRTGDHVRRDEEGFYYVVGRKKDMYISGGENIYPAEIESALASHPAVREVAVVGLADQRWGERGVAFICQIPNSQLPAQIFLEHCRERLARFKLPAAIIMLDSLPRNGTGKVAKQELKRLAHERHATSHH